MSPFRRIIPLGTRQQTNVYHYITPQPQRNNNHMCGCSIFNLGYSMMGMFPMMNSFPMLNMFSEQSPWANMFNSSKAPNNTQNTDTNDKTEGLKKLYPKYEFYTIDNKLYAKLPDGDIVDAKTVDDMVQKLNSIKKPATESTNDDSEGDGPEKNKKADAAAEAGKSTPNKEADSAGQKAKPSHKYDVEQEKTYTIKNYDTWYGIATAKYEIPAGMSKLDVAYALAAANSGEADPDKALQLAKRGLYFAVGDNIKLPAELTVKGKTIKLLADADDKDAYRKESASYRGTGVRSGRMIVSVGGKWYITVDGVRQGTGYATEAEARKHIPSEDS